MDDATKEINRLHTEIQGMRPKALDMCRTLIWVHCFTIEELFDIQPKEFGVIDESKSQPITT
jgi:hypothetical protein